MNISLLGASGSIGTQTIDVIEGLNGQIKLCAFSVNTNLGRALELAVSHRPDMIGVPDEAAAQWLHSILAEADPSLKVDIVTGTDGLNRCAEQPNTKLVVNALIGSVGLRPTIAAIRSGKDVALANKESLVMAGEPIMREAKQNNVRIIPIDSEHSAILQCLQGNGHNRIQKITITASGGPFGTWGMDEIMEATAADALRHPVWKMGKKITIDCATMMNKGFEVIEAQRLYDLDAEQIKVMIHPQSIIHSMVTFVDGATLAQMSAPDMRLPIQYALTAPKRVANAHPIPELDLASYGSLSFGEPDFGKFPCLGLAYIAAKTGGTLPAVMTIVNDYAVEAFLNNKTSFYGISGLIEDAFAAYTVKRADSFEAIYEAERWAADFCNAHEHRL